MVPTVGNQTVQEEQSHRGLACLADLTRELFNPETQDRHDTEVAEPTAG